MWMRRLILPVLLAVLSNGALAEPVKDLVIEKARDTFGAELPEGAQFRVTFQRGGEVDAVLLSAFWMDPSTGQFLANAVTEDGVVERLQGLAILGLSVPVPVRRILPGEVLTKADLKDVDMPYARISAYAVTDAKDLVGKEVRRILSAGRPVISQSVIEPLVITRGDQVSIRYQDGRLALTAPGRAMDDAHRGQEIRIVNLVSNKLVTGVAKDGGVVEIIR